jgi:Raf kinase inhibitor-like YbhB/YbcL family protein
MMILTEVKTMRVKCASFENMDLIPERYTCSGKDINPELIISNIPERTKTLALIMEDPDALNETFDHWLMWNIPVAEKIEENSAPGVQGKNGRGKNEYMGPCPPTGTHHYHFKVYALDSELELDENSDKAALLKAMEGHILQECETIGLFEKNIN